MELTRLHSCAIQRNPNLDSTEEGKYATLSFELDTGGYLIVDVLIRDGDLALSLVRAGGDSSDSGYSKDIRVSVETGDIVVNK